MRLLNELSQNVSAPVSDDTSIIYAVMVNMLIIRRYLAVM